MRSNERKGFGRFWAFQKKASSKKNHGREYCQGRNTVSSAANIGAVRLAKARTAASKATTTISTRLLRPAHSPPLVSGSSLDEIPHCAVVLTVVTPLVQRFLVN